MNMESMRVRSYRSIAADEHVPEEAAERYRTLKACGKLCAAGCSEEGALVRWSWFVGQSEGRIKVYSD